MRTLQGLHTHRDTLNHIISTQIINDIIFGGSLGNTGQLDASGNKEGERERIKDRNKERPNGKKSDRPQREKVKGRKERVEMERKYRNKEVVGGREACEHFNHL